MKILPLKTTKLFQLLLASATLVACGDDGTTPTDTTEGDTDDDDTETNDTVSATSPSTSVTTTSPSTSSPSTTATESDTDPTTGETESTTEPTTGETESTTEPTTGETESTTEPTTGETESTTEPTTGETEEPTTTGLLECVDENLGSGYPISLDGDNTGSGDDLTVSCSGNGGGDEYVYEYTSAEAGVYTFDTDGGALDTAVAVFDGCDGTELACNDDINSLGGNYASRAYALLGADTTYVVAVDSYGGEVGAYTLNVEYLGSETAPAAFCDNAGDAMDSCDQEAGGTATAGGILGCGTAFYQDYYEIDVVEGDCVTVQGDNIDPVAGATGNESGDLRIDVIDPGGSASAIFDDEIPCTDPAFGGYDCPQGNVVATADGTMLVVITQYGGTDCPDDAPYSLDVTVNGEDVDLTGAKNGDDILGLCF
jgi:hypothetical protein